MRKRNSTVILVVVTSVAVAALIVMLAVGHGKSKVSYGDVSDKAVQTVIPSYSTTIANQASSTKTTTTETPSGGQKKTLSEDDEYIKQFLDAAETYSYEDESTTAPQHGFFNVVTDGTVSDDNSLSGLTGESYRIGKLILALGFRYDKNQNIFYSDSQSWQRLFGYTNFYDASAATMGMYYDTIRFFFNYNNMDWRIQLWKGRYGITTGGEIGTYWKKPDLDTAYYEAVPDDQTIMLSFALYRDGQLYMTRGPEKHWWLTGFKLFDMASPDELTMHASFFMTDEKQADALEKAILDAHFVEGLNYQRLGLTMTIVWN